jgi:ferredoxin-like protein FixX
MDIKITTTVETKLGTLEWKKQPEANIHLKNAGADSPCATKCDNKPCTTVCPAKVYEWEGAHKKIVVNYENCIECGAGTTSPASGPAADRALSTSTAEAFSRR